MGVRGFKGARFQARAAGLALWVPRFQRGWEEVRGRNPLDEGRLGQGLKWSESGTGGGVGRGRQRRDPRSPELFTGHVVGKIGRAHV